MSKVDDVVFDIIKYFNNRGFEVRVDFKTGSCEMLVIMRKGEYIEFLSGRMIIDVIEKLEEAGIKYYFAPSSEGILIRIDKEVL